MAEAPLSKSDLSKSPRAAIVFDASGSMWGRIDGESKISIAKEALRDLIEKWNSDIPLGLTIYGHRKKGDCNDIENVIPVGPIEKEKIFSIIKDIQPKGKTPIVRSLQKVAKELHYRTESATIILISDGRETCDADPLQAIKKLKKQGFHLIIHVVGFDVDGGTSDQLRSLAKATGGVYFPAKDASSLNKAFQAITHKIEKAKPIVPPEKNLQITASETKKGDLIEVLHKIYPHKRSKTSQILQSCVSYSHIPCSIKVPAGRYIIDSSYNLYSKETAVEVYEENITKSHIVMGETGELSLTASETERGAKIALHYTLYADKNGQIVMSGNTHTEREVIERLPVGKYTLGYRYYSYQNRLPLEIKAKENIHLNIIAGKTGKITLSASEVKGGEDITASHAFYKLDQNNKITKSATALCDSQKERACQVQLPVGKYLIQSRYRDYSVKTTLTLPHQKTITKHIIFKPTGEIAITAKEQAKGNAIVAEYMIMRDDPKAEKREIIQYGKTDALKPITVELFAGKYQIEAKYCSYKRVFPLEIKADTTSQRELIMGETGYVKISAVIQKSGEPIDASYRLYDEHNKSIELIGTACQKREEHGYLLQLPVGDYSIQALYKPFEQIKKVHIESGKRDEIVFIMNPSGEVQISADEESGRKRVKAFHTIYPLTSAQKVYDKNSSIETCTSEGKYLCELKLPIGKYLLHTRYNRFKRETAFEIKEDETLALNIIMGQTGEVNITAYEKPNGKPIQEATHYIREKDNKSTKEIKSCWHDLHCIARLPVGVYSVMTKYNILKKETAFEIREGETTNLSVVMGEIGKVEISAITSADNQKVNASHNIYTITNQGELKQITLMCWYDNKIQGCTLSLPIGKYLLKSRYKESKKETAFEIQGGEVERVTIIFDR